VCAFGRMWLDVQENKMERVRLLSMYVVLMVCVFLQLCLKPAIIVVMCHQHTLFSRCSFWLQRGIKRNRRQETNQMKDQKE